MRAPAELGPKCGYSNTLLASGCATLAIAMHLPPHLGTAHGVRGGDGDRLPPRGLPPRGQILDGAIKPPVWPRHAHANQAIDHEAPLPLVQATLGHGSVGVTSGYLHARPGDSSDRASMPACFFDEADDMRRANSDDVIRLLVGKGDSLERSPRFVRGFPRL